jgi:hypothetical protein
MFCPECGTGLAQFRSAIDDDDVGEASRRETPPARRSTGDYGRRKSTASRARSRPPRAVPQASATHREAAHSAKQTRLSPVIIWMTFGILAVIVVVAVLALNRTPSGAVASSGSSSQASAQLGADTSGSYSDLVTRANGLYDQGAQALQRKDQNGASRFFGAAAKVYRAAWKKQPGDPSVGTDYATSLFYSGDSVGALKQVDLVLAKSPDYQSAHLNRGIYLQTASQAAAQRGDSAKAASLLAKAKTELQSAVAVDPASSPGTKAAEILKGP